MVEVLTVAPTGTEPGLCVRVVGTVSTTGGGGTKTPADGTANPTDATDAESFNMAWNGTTWDRIRSSPQTGILAIAGPVISGSSPVSNSPVLIGGANNGPMVLTLGVLNNETDAFVNALVNTLVTQDHLNIFNGTTWDRVRSGTAIGSVKVNNDIAANLKVDASGTTVTAQGTKTPADATANPTDALDVESFNMVWNGATWDRLRSGTAIGSLKVNNDTAANLLAQVSGTVTANQGGAPWQVHGDTASGSADANNPLKIGGVARTSDITAVTNGQRVNATLDTLGKQIFLQGATNDRIVSGTTNYTTTTAADVIAAQGVGVRIVVTSILVTNFSTATNTKVEIRDGTTVKVIGAAWNSGGGFARDAGGVALFISTANAAVTARCVTTGADVDVSISGYLITN